MINCSKSEQIKHHLCSKLWVRPCGATEGFGRVLFLKGGGCLKHRLRVSAPSCLLSPVWKPKAASSSLKQNDKHPHGGNAQKTRGFIVLYYCYSINCVINAIQQLCKQAVSDAVSYLQYEDNKNDAFGGFFNYYYFSRRHGFGFSRHLLTA